MISTSSLVLDGHHGHGLGPGSVSGPGGSHHMAFEPFLRNKLPVSVPEFIRPLPKPAPMVPRYNNHRPQPPPSPRKDYLPVTINTSSGPVNLTSSKHESDSLTREMENQISRSSNCQIPPHLAAAYTNRMFPSPGFHYPGLQGPYGSLYPSPYSSLLNSRPTYINSTPLSPLEQQYSPPTTSTSYLQSYNTQTTAPVPTPVQPSHLSVPQPQSVPTYRRLINPPPAKPPVSSVKEKKSFKVPSGKQQKTSTANNNKTAVKRIVLPTNVNNNNNLLPPNFAKGALIQLGNGDLKRVEEVTTEDLVSSASKCSAYRLDPATVVRIQENSNGTAHVTLSCAENKISVEIESSLEHPYFVYGRGWASCSPDRTISCYGLQCYKLQVGDICMSLSPRPTTTQDTSRPTLGTTKSNLKLEERADKDLTRDCRQTRSENDLQVKQEESEEDINNKKRRWSAPDQFDTEDEFIDPGSPSPSPNNKRFK